MNNLLGNVRFYIISFSLFLALALYLIVKSVVPVDLQMSRLVQVYAFAATIYLYLTLLISPLIHSFRSIPHVGTLIKSRRGLGVSAYIFAFLHMYIVIFINIGGFSKFLALPAQVQFPMRFGSIAFFILTLLAATSFDSIMRKMTFPTWKWLHRSVYLASMLIITHALLLGEHFSDLSALIPRIFTIALAVLIILEIPRLIAYFRQKFVKID
ncbi:MAG: ferric reductase-like transmembrane domain-containing protein [Microgenomates group bacterium]